jgi:hypothetical protein
VGRKSEADCALLLAISDWNSGAINRGAVDAALFMGCVVSKCLSFNVRFDGEFPKQSGLVMFTSSFVEIDPNQTNGPAYL